MNDAARGSFSRREWLALGSLAAAAAPLEGAQSSAAARAPAAPVSIAKCPNYDVDLVAQLETMFDQIGGIGKLVHGKTVAVKLNVTGGGRFEGFSAGETHWVHPKLVGACCAALGKAGARRVRLVEGAARRRPGSLLEDKLLN